jgi:competence protein ComEC
MKAVVQRVKKTTLSVDGKLISEIPFGLTVYLGIKTGDTEVLIDAGSDYSSATIINQYLKQYCTDGVLEYVIATHAHKDHIAAFVGDNSNPGVFSQFETGIIIDYTARKTTSQVSKDYEAARDAEVQAGATHYTALECWEETNGAKRSYELGENITLNILYQKYYREKTSNENNYSVCVMVSENDNHYLFTGDLESGGEASLIENNELPKCKVYKGGHHGSNTSSTDALLSVIQPEIVCVCSCAGDKHGFPHQEFIDRVSVWTDKV